MTAGINTSPKIGALRNGPRPRDAEDFPIGTRVRTPLGHIAEVIAHRGGRRLGAGVADCHDRLVCRYDDPKNRRFGYVVLRAELVTKVEGEK